MELKLSKPIKSKLVKALRSGEYKQGIGKLYDEYSNCYCVLGVLGKVCGLENAKLKGKTYFSVTNKNKIPEIMIGNFDDSKKDYNPLVKKLVNFNDFKHLSFKWIASYIERYL